MHKPKRVYSFRLSEENVEKLETVTDEFNKINKRKAEKHGLVFKELSRAEVLEWLIDSEYNRTEKGFDELQIKLAKQRGEI